jgi:integrase
MGTIRFEIRKDKADKEGKCPIRIVYQIQQQRKYSPTTIKLFPINWKAEIQQAIYIDKRKAKQLAPATDFDLLLTEREVKELNGELKNYETKINNIEKRFSLDGIVYTPEMTMEALAAVNKPESMADKPGESVTAFIHQFVKDRKANNSSPVNSLKVYSGLAAHLTAFEKRKKNKLTFNKLTVADLKAFNGFLTSVKKVNNVTAAKQLSTLKTLLNKARTEYNIPVNTAFRDFTVSRKEESQFEVITITEDELFTLYNLDLSGNKRLDKVRDVFCFSCFTGLRYSDLKQLKRIHIRGNIIKMTAVKTDQLLEIPLTTYSAAILEKYKESERPLPVITNQKTNDYLKELCQQAAIETPVEIVRKYGAEKVREEYKKYQLISIHAGRKTFVTLSLEKGMAPQEVMAITGHTDYKSFKRYVKVTQERKQAVMAKAWGEVKAGNLKAV